LRSFKKRLALACALLFGAGLMAPSVANASGLTVTVCHNGNEIEVGLAAAAFHALYHGDDIGGCVQEPPCEPPCEPI